LPTQIPALPFTTAPASLCILRLSAIGDVCHTLAIVRAIQDQWPQAKLTWIISKLEHSLIGDIDGIEFLVYDKSQGNQARQAIKQQLNGRQFDALLHMQISLRSSRLARLVQTPIKLGYDKKRAKDYQWLFTNQKIPFKPQQHVMDGLFGFAETLGVSRPADEQLRWDIPLSNADREFAQQHIPDGRKALVISPCSSQRARNFRNWSVDNYIAAAKQAIDHGAKIIITGGPTELETAYAKAICDSLDGQATNLAGKTTLKQLLALLDQATALLGPDSGPAHMANSVRTPVIGLFATSNPERTGPYFSTKQGQIVDAYPAAAKKFLNKTVAELSWGQRVRDGNAMLTIEVSEVGARIDRIFTPHIQELGHE
jgi:heptosyltransferase I